MAFFVARYQCHSPTEILTAGDPVFVKYLYQGGGYYLVPLYQQGGLTGIVEVGEASREVRSSAKVKDAGSRFILPEEEAVTIVRNRFHEISDFATPFLGWKPCRESFSSLYPLWVFPHGSGEVYVTQSGEATEVLSLGLGGG